jgi:phosphoglycolate phosphatase/pyrophosphatase PpaX
MAKFDAILFDMDGTLTDSEGSWYHGFIHMMEHYGKEPVTEEEYVTLFVGVRMTECVMKVFPEFKNEQISEAKEIWRRGFLNEIDKVGLQPHAMETLEFMKSNGLMIALATNTHSKVTGRVFDIIEKKNPGFNSYFDFKGTSDQVENPKPYPDLVRHVCDSIGVDPSKAIFVEDSVTGVIAGKAAGVYTVGFSTEEESRRRLKEAGADVLITSLKELEGIVK